MVKIWRRRTFNQGVSRSLIESLQGNLVGAMKSCDAHPRPRFQVQFYDPQLIEVTSLKSNNAGKHWTHLISRKKMLFFNLKNTPPQTSNDLWP